MSLKTFLRSTGLALAALAASAMIASASDKVTVEFPFNVTVGNKVLEPGKYTIRQLENSNAKALLIHNNDGEFQTMVMPIPAYSLRVPEDTKVVLHRIGDQEYHFDKIWIQGKDLGYEIPLSAKAKARQAEWMLARATVKPAASEALPAVTQDFTEVAQAFEPLAAAPDRSMPSETVPAVETIRQPETTALDVSPAVSEETIEMPETAANWVPILLLGAGISVVGWGATRRR